MMVMTKAEKELDSAFLDNYFGRLVNHFFKILPIKETNEETLCVYIKSLQMELIGCQELISGLNNDAAMISLVSILQFFIDHPDVSKEDLKREVFRAINICNKLKARYDGSVESS